MKSLFAPLAKTGGSLGALAAALAVALTAVPAAAQEDTPRSARAERPARPDITGGRQRVDMPRVQAPRAPRADTPRPQRADTPRAAPRFAAPEAPRPQRAAPPPVGQTAPARPDGLNGKREPERAATTHNTNADAVRAALAQE